MHSRLATDPRLADRMRVEAQSLGRLNHPHIVQITGFGTTRDGRPFLVMEWLRGQTLTSELATFGKLHAKEALRLSIQLLSALAAAHAIGIVHRDVKPDNLFLAYEPDGSRQLKVLDFGIARVLPDAPGHAPDPLSVPTATGVVVGTPRFVSPEGALGQRVDGRADLYSAALVLYGMVAGRGPFDHVEGDQPLLHAHVRENPLPPSQFAEVAAPALLDAVILKGLAKDPNRRYQSALEFKSELERLSNALFAPIGVADPTTADLRHVSSHPPPRPSGVPAALPPPPPTGPIVVSPSRRPPAQEMSQAGPSSSSAPRAVAGRTLVTLVFVSAIALAALVAAGLVVLLGRLL
jgi:serine/threonine-protein kinase